MLHLKSAVTALDEATVLVFPGAVGPEAFAGLRVVAVAGGDPEAANVVRLPDGRILVAATCRRAPPRCAPPASIPVACDVSEFARADGGLTCLSLRCRPGLAPAQP